MPNPSDAPVQPPVSDSAEGFAFREDYALFGLLVLHGLCRPRDFVFLVQHQREEPSPRPLMTLLAEHNRLPSTQRADIRELLDVLATPKLRDTFPKDLPAFRTLVEQLEATVRTATDDAESATIADGLSQHRTSRSVQATSSLVSSGSVLSEEEQSRVQGAKGKGRLVGQSLAGHVVIDVLGSGGQGDVYLAKQVSLNRYVAMKSLEVPSGASTAVFVDNFRREAETLARVNHARVVKVFEIFEAEGLAFFTMEYLRGRSLREVIKSGDGPMPLDVVANLACQACSALARTAEAGLVHRDIKPANLMIEEGGDLKIVDFGLAAATSQQGASFAGTPHYASPEQAASKPIGPASDQYSLGLTLYHALTGSMPYLGTTMHDVLEQQMHAPLPVPSSVNPELPRSVDRVLTRMTEKDPAKRFPNFDACFEAWERILVESTSKRGSAARSLLGESLVRLSRGSLQMLVVRGLVFGIGWILFAAGAHIATSGTRSAETALAMKLAGDIGTVLITFSIACIFYVAAARRKWLPTLGDLRTWLYVHIASAIPAIALLLVHSGDFLVGALPGGAPAKPILSILMSLALVITAVSGVVGLVLFRGLRRQLQVQQLDLRGSALGERAAMATALGAQALSGWRLVHYPLAVLFMVLSVLHILAAIKFSVS